MTATTTSGTLARRYERDFRVEDIIADPLNQPRKETSERHVERIVRGGSLGPPVLVEYRNGAYTLRDGFHRLAAARRAGIQTIRATVTLEDEATIHAEVLRSNTARGDDWSYADTVRHIVNGIRGGAYTDPDGTPWSISRIARETRPRSSAKEVDAARKAISRVAGKAAAEDPRVRDALRRINAVHKPDADTRSEERPSIEDLRRCKAESRKREANGMARDLQKVLRKMPLKDRREAKDLIAKVPS